MGVTFCPLLFPQNKLMYKWCNFFLKYWVKVLSEVFWVWPFSCGGKDFTHNFNFCDNYITIQVIHLLLSEFDSLYLPRNIFISTNLSNNWHNFFVLHLCYPFYDYKVHSEIPYFKISDIEHLFILFCFLHQSEQRSRGLNKFFV